MIVETIHAKTISDLEKRKVEYLEEYNPAGYGTYVLGEPVQTDTGYCIKIKRFKTCD